MPKYRTPRGTRDLLPAERAAFVRIESIAADLGRRYGYRAMDTPLFEQAEVFERGVGATSDIVEKELFRVSPSRGDEGERWALRPEATAGIVRAYVQHGMHALPQPVRLSLTGPMFRYDRPQAGRYRQLWQWDVEAIGDPGPAVDAELIELATRFYAEVGLPDVVVHLNSIGDAACRPAYVEELRAYFAAHESTLPETDRARLATNPLRLLDSKEPEMAPLIAAAPRIADRLCDACRAHYERVGEHLEALRVPVRPAPTLVRGLDYYTRTTFEFSRRGAEGQQQSLAGGGRYDGLVELLGGRPTPGIGFAIGLDRVVLALAESGRPPSDPEPVRAVVVSTRPADTLGRLRIATQLRALGIAARAELGERKLGRQLETAAKEGARFAVILGEEPGGEIEVRDLVTGTQRRLSVDALPAALSEAWPHPTT